MSKQIKIAIVLLIGFLAFLWLEKPLKHYLNQVLEERAVADLLAGAVVRLLLISPAVGVVQKLRLLQFAGLKPWRRFANLQAVGIALAFIAIGITSNWGSYQNASAQMLVLFAISTLAVGVVEELIFRGAIFPLFIQAFAQAKRPILKSAVLSSLMFGMVHFVNLFNQPHNWVGISSQVFFATAIGVFFCGLLVRTENILIPCLIHALVNFSFGAADLNETVSLMPEAAASTGINWNSLLPTTLFFAFIFMGGVYMILKSDEASVLRTLPQIPAALPPTVAAPDESLS